MAQKDLTVRVKLDTSKAEKALSQFKNKITATNKAVDRSVATQNRVTRSIERSAAAMNKVSTSATRANTAAKRLKSSVDGVVNASGKMKNNFNDATAASNKMAQNISRAQRLIAGFVAAYKAIEVVDAVASAENRLNYVNGYNTNATEQDMRKMYNAAMGARTGYLDMVGNVSKSMTLAGGAFGGNIDNAIRFQEVMAKAYSIGGASVAEQASSMYQMIQALGSGVLQGDELRSVREGAPLAYQAIEKFAQGVYNSTDSLKEMASQGKITSSVVVQAILDAGKQMDDAFGKTKMTFGQVITMMKNVAVESFRPAMESLINILNSDDFMAFLNKLVIVIQFAGRLLQTVFGFLERHTKIATALFIALASIIGITLIGSIVRAIGAVITFGTAGFIAATKATIGFLATHAALTAMIVIIIGIIAIMMLLSDSFSDACGKMVGAAYAAGAGIYNAFAWAINGVMEMLAALLDYGTRMFSVFTSNIALIASMIDTVAGTDYSSKFGTNALSKIKPIEYKSISDSYKKGYGVGSNFGTKTMNGIKDWLYGGAARVPDSMGKYSGLDYGDLMNSAQAGANPVADDVSKIKDSTSKMADSMAISEEYLKLLRQIAEDSWKRGVTSVNIEVAMNNQATVKSESDLDGLVSKLTSKLEEELSATASGVYA